MGLVLMQPITLERITTANFRVVRAMPLVEDDPAGHEALEQLGRFVESCGGMYP